MLQQLFVMPLYIKLLKENRKGEMILLQIYFIRHGLTSGNLSKRYIGCRSDEDLCDKGIQQVKNLRKYFLYKEDIDYVFCSPMKRCIQTAEYIFPEKSLKVYKDLAECDFGKFEGKNYDELKGNNYYQKWIDSGGTISFPDGESQKTFKERVCREFSRIINENKFESAAMVAHGGTYMSILSEYERDYNRSFFEWNISNAEVLKVQVTENPLKLHIIQQEKIYE